MVPKVIATFIHFKGFFGTSSVLFVCLLSILIVVARLVFFALSCVDDLTAILSNCCDAVALDLL